MANEKNLKPVRTKSEARERGKNGGKKSGAARRNKKLLKDCMVDLLALPVTTAKYYNKLAKMGINPEEIDNRSLLTVALFMRAVECGDVNAFKEIKHLIGEDAGQDLTKLDEVLDKIEGNI